MDSPRALFDITQRRTAPGMMLFDLEEKLIFANEEAQHFFLASCDGGDDSTVVLPEGILAFLGALREPDGSMTVNADIPCMVLRDRDGLPYAFRAFPYSQDGQEGDITHVMVLAERIIPRHEPDFERVQSTYGLTRREVQVLKEIHSGKATKAISNTLCICEYTVRDHVKKIMQKMAVRSRSELLSLL